MRNEFDRWNMASGRFWAVLAVEVVLVVAALVRFAWLARHPLGL